jgi:hypothetical protein
MAEIRHVLKESSRFVFSELFTATPPPPPPNVLQGELIKAGKVSRVIWKQNFLLVNRYRIELHSKNNLRKILHLDILNG